MSATPEQQPTTEQTQTSNVISISRTTFNYVGIAIIFFIVGAIVGGVGYQRIAQSNDEALLDSTVNRMEDVVVSGVNTAFAAMGIQVEAPQQQEAARLDPSNRYELMAESSAADWGVEDALVTMVEFGDFQCGFCGRFARETLSKIQETYGDRVNFVYRDYVIFGDPSYRAALAAQCAKDQDKFWEFHDLIYSNQRELTQETFVGYAESLDMDVEAFTQCFTEETHRQKIVDETTYASTLNMTGTPTFFINGRPISGAQPFEVFQRVLDEELQAAEQALAES